MANRYRIARQGEKEGVGIVTQREHQEGISEEDSPVTTDRKMMGSLERDTGLEPATFALARPTEGGNAAPLAGFLGMDWNT
jgi:hypothetical protein